MRRYLTARHPGRPQREHRSDVTERIAKEWEELYSGWRGFTRRHPVLTWGAAGAAAAGALLGGGYVLTCYVLPRYGIALVMVGRFAALMAPPLAGVLTAPRSRRLYGLWVGLGVLSLLAGCVQGGAMPRPTPTPTPAPQPTPRPSWCPPTSTPTPTATPTPTPPPYIYTVQSGETLSEIAARFGLTTEALKQANGLSNDLIYPGQPLHIPVDPPETLDPVLRQLMLTERPTRLEHQQAWGALYVFGDPDFYPNNWWLQDGKLSIEDVLLIIMQGEVGSNEGGLQAIAGRYLYFCGATPDCQGDTAALLDFLAYYQAWRESGRVPQKPFLSPPLPEQVKIAQAIVSGDSATLKEYGFAGDIYERFRADLPFHFANVSPEWNDLLIRKLARPRMTQPICFGSFL